MIIFCSSEYANRRWVRSPGVGIGKVRERENRQQQNARNVFIDLAITASRRWLVVPLRKQRRKSKKADARSSSVSRTLLFNTSRKLLRSTAKTAARPCRKPPGHTSDAPTMKPENICSLARLSSGLSRKIKTTISRVCTSDLSAHASRRMKPALDKFRQDCRVSTIGSSTLSDFPSRANSGIRQVSLAPSC